ncbi:MAG: N-6 DNA methylase [Candidatus Moranbacteria bacterium]|jgi:type I restriction enzyme M protein|nr:N-6 DNA methylase [Candidatus Moranbacteria bacterium]
MLDQTTKRKIDSARQILVGKVPDPKAQVEQITNALIYKFMDDMDKENEEVGLKTQFFVDEWKKYSWTKLLDNRLSGQERLDLYVQAITNMSKNPHIPQLFRDIFKGAFLPYNDPRTLSLFLKEINEFNYEHSENLGNAFEYLLSCLQSQGDAGMFRTPRHIIDFIVSVVDPKKNETILDPACGTAGFLISAYKHILRQHDGMDDAGRPNSEKGLSPDEKNRLMSNFSGYDISPDMVKLALVNLYLHGFPEPKIYEYDTLSSEKRWDESFDVILANPPFMTPKGGIVPHKRFSIQANRAEVLFVDYIVEHLTIKGRAGIIVPEGIIFQSNKAYKQLRKKLIEDGLFAVVSLPAGVFNPYAGVKTSILLFDNEISKKTKNFLFLKIQNDGFDLGAQRREHNKNDLPLALEVIKKYKLTFSDKNFSEEEKQIAYIVAKEKIAETGDYNLSGERYKEIIHFANQKWEIVELNKIADIGSGNSAPQDKELFKNGKHVFFRTSDVAAVHICDNLFDSRDKLTDAGAKGLKLFPKNTILFPKSGASTFLNHRAMIGIDGYVSSHLATITPNENKILPKFLFNLLKRIDAKKLTNDQNYPSLKTSEIAKIKIPLPPMEVQKEIVEQIEVKQKAIDAAKEIIKNLERERRYFGASLRKLESVEWVELDRICNLEYGFTDKAKDNGDARFIRITDIDENGMIKTRDQKFINLTDEAKKYLLKKDDLLVARTGATYGKTAIFKESYPAVFASYLIKLDFEKDKILPEFYWLFAQSDEYWDQAKKLMTGGGQQQFNANAIKRVLVPIISMERQRIFVAEAEKEQKIIEANKRLIGIMERKIEDVLSEI